QIEEVIVTEAPISQTLLSRRVLNAWGISRLGVRLTEYLNTLYSKLYVKRTFQNGQPFIWSVDQEPMRYRKFRIPTDDKSKRNADDLPAEEVAAAIVNILVNQVSLPKDDLVRETARLFGYSRIGGNVGQAMNTGIDYAVKNKMIAESNSRFIVG